MQTYEAIRILRRMRNLIPEDELCSMIDAQNDAAALDEAIEALRVKAGYPPRLPGYITIAKTRYSFKKGFMQVSIGEKNAVKKELMGILGITGKTYFSTILNAGIPNISITKYNAITQAFARRGITDVWTTEEA